MRMSGRAWVFGDDIAIDEQMLPMRFMTRQEYDFDEMARHLMAGADPGFPERVRPGDLIVGGLNFGQGNAHVLAFLTMRHLRLGILAESMARGAFRAAINAGVPVLTPCPDLRRHLASGDPVEVDYAEGLVRDLRTGAEVRVPPLPELLRRIVEAGGGFAYAKQVYAQRRAPGGPS